MADICRITLPSGQAFDLKDEGAYRKPASGIPASDLAEGIALALAFVICYNMGLMNFTERTREYATLKVLGYHQREIRRLILSENIILTTLGMLLGILPGYQLTYAVMRVCESEMTRYTAWPETLTVVICCGISFGFSLLIQLLLTRNVKKIDMVEALKSVE